MRSTCVEDVKKGKFGILAKFSLNTLITLLTINYA